MKLSIGVPAPSGTFTAYYVAVQDGIFKQHGIDASIHILHGSGSEVAALQSGSIQLAVIDANAAIPPMAKGVKGVLVGAGATRSIWSLWSIPSIKTLKGLEGHTLGNEHVNGGADVTMKEFLPKLGVNLANVKVDYIGNPSATAAAFIAGKVDSAMDVAPWTVEFKKKGFRQLYDFRNTTHVSDGLMVMRSWAKQHPGIVKAALEVWAQGTTYMYNPANLAKTEAAMVRYTHVSDKAQLKAELDYYKPVLSCYPGITTNDVADSIAWAKTHYHQSIKASQVIDTSYLDAVKSTIQNKYCK